MSSEGANSGSYIQSYYTHGTITPNIRSVVNNGDMFVGMIIEDGLGQDIWNSILTFNGRILQIYLLPGALVNYSLILEKSDMQTKMIRSTPKEIMVQTPTQIYKGTSAGASRVFSLNLAGWAYDWYVDPRDSNGDSRIK